MLKNNKLIISTVIVIILGLTIGIGLNLINPGPKSVDIKNRINNTSQIDQSQLTSTKMPTPTISPLYMKISNIDSQFIYITGEKGTARLSNDSSKVKVFRREDGQLVAGTLSDVKVGQNVTIEAVIPGRESHLIIEP